MAVGFSPKFVESFPLTNLTPGQFIAYAVEAAKRLNWSVGPVEPNGFVAYTKFSMSSWAEQVRVSIANNVVTLKSECTGNQFFDWGKNKKNIREFLSEFELVKASVTSEELQHKPEELEKTINAGNSVPEDTTATMEKNVGFISLFIPREGYAITPILLIINIGIFIWMIASGVDFMAPTGEQLIKWGANFRPSTLDGEWWRLLTCCFLHIGVLHLLMNMYALVYIGLLLEPRLGSMRFLTAYLVTGIASSTASLWWHPLTVSAGASGAIFGMYGVFLAMLTTNLIEKTTRKALLTSIGIFVGYNLFYGMKGGIDNAAHIGGLITGLLAGYVFLPSLKNPSSRNLMYLTTGGFALLIVFSSLTFAKGIRNDIGIYDEKMKTFSSRESMALEVFSLPETTPKDSILYEIKERGIYYWNENIQLVNELEKLDLPEAVHDRNKLLIEYCEVRIQSYNLLYNGIKEGTENYKDSIGFYKNKIETLISSLSSK